MRLICGVLRLDDGAVDDVVLRSLAASLVAEGLDPRVKTWRGGPVGLAVLDFSAGRSDAAGLPQSGGRVMAADVRLDEPGSPDIPEEMRLLAALEPGAAAGLGQLLGDFAFASWDADTGVLTCGRDIFGVRPLSYAYQPGKLFAFASFGQALLEAGFVPKAVDTDALARRFVHAFRADDSLIAGVRRLPAAHCLELSRQGLAIKRYWQLDRAVVGTRKISADDAARELRALADQAVRCRLPRGGEVGAHLSGGLDSSALCVLAARRLRGEGRTLHAYSFLDRQRNDVALEDESEFVAAVLQQEGDIDWTAIRPSADPPAFGAPVSVDSMAPLSAGAPEVQVCRCAAAKGVSLILSGWGGDEDATFNGRGVLAELFLRGRWPTLWQEIAALSRERRWPKSQLWRGEVLSPLWGRLLPGSVLDAMRRHGSRDEALQDLLRRALSPKARRRLRGEAALSLGPDGRENRWRLTTSPHIAHRTELWAQTGARHGLAYAFPLLDRRVVEFCLSLPSELFLRGGFRRRVFRDAMTDVLPERVRLRHHKHAPFPSNMLLIAEQKEAFTARIGALENNELIREVFDVAYLRALVDDFPSPDQARQEMRGNAAPKADAAMIAVASALRSAAFIDQHGSR